MPGTEPLVALAAAAATVAAGDAGEVELEWAHTHDDPGTETRLTITVRRETTSVATLAKDVRDLRSLMDEGKG